MTAQRGSNPWVALTLSELQALGTTDEGVAVNDFGQVTGATTPGDYRCTAVAAGSSTWVINAAAAPSGGGWTKKYELDFATVATSVDLKGGGDGTKTIAGISTWEYRGSTNMTSADVDGADAGGTGLNLVFNTTVSAFGFTLDVLLTDLEATIDVNSDLRVFLQYNSDANALYESIGTRILNQTTLQGSSASLYSASALIGSNPNRAYVEAGNVAGVEIRSPTGRATNTTDCLLTQISNGSLSVYQADTALGALPTDMSGMMHAHTVSLQGAGSGSVRNAMSNARFSICGYTGNSYGNFNPIIKKFSIWQRE